MTTKIIHRQVGDETQVHYYLIDDWRHTLMQVANRIGLSTTAARRRIEKIGLDGALDPKQLAEANREVRDVSRSERARQANSIHLYNPGRPRTTDHLRNYNQKPQIAKTEESRQKERWRRKIDLVRDAQNLDAVTREVWQ